MNDRLCVSAVIWDIDDVLIDTAGARRQAQYRVLRRLGYTEAELTSRVEAWDRLFWFYRSTDYRGILEVLSLEWGLGLEMSEIEALSQSLAIDIQQGMSTRSGIPETLSCLHKHGILQGIVSNGEKELQMQKLTATHIRHHFMSASIIIYPSSSPKAKPRSYGILECCSGLGGSPQQIVYVGDRTIDIIAANLAGCQSIRLFSNAPEALEPIKGPELSIERSTFSVDHPLEILELLGLAG